MINGIKNLLGMVLIIGTFFMPSFSFAESGIDLYESDIDVQTYPEIPKPYENVDINLISYATDLNRAIIEWKVGSQIVSSGYGKTSYSMNAPGPDSTIAISITITPAESMNKITKSVTIKTSEIDLLYEATEGYTPLFYKGKKLITKNSNIKVVAIPNTKTITSGKGNISYTWKSADTTVQEASGYNKDSYIFKNETLNKSENITVMASSIDGRYTAVKNIDIPIYSPKIIFYKRSPTEGILYNEALSNNTVFAEEEMTVVAEPYFLGIKGNENLFTYTWKINGESIKTPSKKTELTIRPTDRGGFATVNLTVENLNELFQKASATLKLNL